LAMPKRFPAKWVPVRIKKTRQIKNLEPRSDSSGTEMALVYERVYESARKSKQSVGDHSVGNRKLW
jgi:hypothetical protein